MSSSGRSCHAQGSPVPKQLDSRYLHRCDLPCHLIAIVPGSRASVDRTNQLRDGRQFGEVFPRLMAAMKT